MFIDPDDFEDDDIFEYDGYQYDLFDDADDEDDLYSFYDTPLHQEGLQDD